MRSKPSHNDVRRISDVVMGLRVQLKLPHHESFPLIEFLEFDVPKIKNYADFRLVMGTDERFPEGILAFAMGSPLQIVVRDRIYCDAVSGDTSARHALAHELGHVLLGHVGRSHESNGNTVVWADKSTRKLEWEADEFASELLVPSHVARAMTCCEIAFKFDVSVDFAWRRLEVLKERGESRNAGLPLRESAMANSQLDRFVDSPLYSTRPKFLDAIRASCSPTEVMNRTLRI
jgi:hypothetical protein